jgi:sterol desaturase/sphingolipid hydroxylase (fatty acid hydroxylase superfamily)
MMEKHQFLHELFRSTLYGVAVYLASAAVVIAAELLNGRTMAAYRSRNALNDLAYVVFYQCSIYNLLVSPLFAVLSPRLQFLKIGLLLRLPPLVSIFAAWLIFDFLNYWLHRMQHAVKPLWAFHSVHHSQTELTFLTGSRIHVLEQVSVGILMLAPVFILGLPQPRLLPILVIQIFSESVQHARLKWTYGPFHRLLVSPAFHAVHHSADARDHNTNFGRIFSWWDVLFGTFVRSEPAAVRYGVDGMDVDERLIAQFFQPFRMLT